jgi:hypothetical protein
VGWAGLGMVKAACGIKTVVFRYVTRAGTNNLEESAVSIFRLFYPQDGVIK